MIEITPRHLLSTTYVVSVDRVELTRVTDTLGPLNSSFALAGRNYRVSPQRSAHGLLGVLGSAVKFALQQGRWQLMQQDGPQLALAQRRGFSKAGFDLDFAGRKAALEPVEGQTLQTFDLVSDWSGPGRVAMHPQNRRGVLGELPATLAPELQVFVGLLALSCWEVLENGSGA
jgi:hypothetical protein